MRQQSHKISHLGTFLLSFKNAKIAESKDTVMMNVLKLSVKYA